MTVNSCPQAWRPDSPNKSESTNRKLSGTFAHRVSPFVSLVAATIAVLTLSACGSGSASLPPAAHSVSHHLASKRVKAVKHPAVLGHVIFISSTSLAIAQRGDRIDLSKLHKVSATVEAGKPIAWIAKLNLVRKIGVVALSVTRVSGLGCHPCAVLTHHQSVHGADIAGILTAHAQKVAHMSPGGYRIDYSLGHKRLATSAFILTASGSTGASTGPY